MLPFLISTLHNTKMKKTFNSIINMKNIKALMLGLPIVLASCNNNSKIDFSNSKKGLDSSNTEFETISLPKKVAVNPVYEDLDVPFSSFKVDASKDTVLTFGEKETQIKIPARSFVYKNGKPVEGEVNIDYREIRSVAEIMLSGITMEYDSAGTTYDFQTAGMFDIRGYKNGEPIEIAPDKPLTIEYKSDQTDGDYNFYCLDEEKANWDYLSTPKVEIENSEVIIKNEASSSLQNSVNKKSYSNSTHTSNGKTLISDSLKKALPIKPQLALKDQELWDFEYNLTRYPRLKQYAGVMWQFAGEKDNNPLHADTGLIWNPISIQPIEGTDGVYQVDLKAKEHDLSMKMKPVYMGKHYKDATKIYKEKLAAYKAAKRKELKERELLAQVEANGGFFNKDGRKQNQIQVQQTRQRRGLRTMNINQFGIFNCDRYGRVPAVKNLIAAIDSSFNGKVARAFVVAAEGTVVVNWNSLINGNTKFRYSEAEDNKLVLLFPDKKVATFSSEQFNKLKVNRGNSSDNPYVFETVFHKSRIESPEDLDQVINSI